MAERYLLPSLALIIGVGISLLLASLVGENPLTVLSVLVNGAVGSPTQIGYSLFYATPLIFTGLSVAWAFQAGLFNIGAEGQMALGGLAIAAVGSSFPNLPSLVAIPLALSAAFLAGGFWAAIAGWMKVKRGCHEVLTTIMLNFIAFGLVSFFVLSVLHDPESQVPETAPVGAGYQLSQLSLVGGTSPLSTALLFAIVAAIIYSFVFRKTRAGFTQKLVGGAPEVAKRAGVNVDREVIKAMFISGGIAGLAGIGLILGFSHKTREGFTAGLGFVGIAVALLGRNGALGVVLAAILFGALTKGSLDLDLDTEFVTRDLAVVIQALIVLCVASHKGLFDLLKRVGVLRD
jgi:general nucleoside transport system permease protein